MYTGVLVVLIVPFLWSAAIAGLKRIPGLSKDLQYLDDKTEKRHLALMLLPVLIGLMGAVAAHFVSFSLPLPALPLAPNDDDPATSVAPAAAAVAIKAHVDWFYWAVIGSAILYGAGLAINCMRLAVGLIRLGRLASQSRPAAGWGQGVRVTRVKTPPLVLGRTTILMPESLIPRLTQAQMQMILRHEREHLKRGDARWFIALAVVDAIFWFNPFVRHQTRRCRLAAELACDAAVVASAPEMRGTYAEALVRVLKHAAGDVRQYAPTAFSPEKSGDYRMRITEIMRPPARSGKPRLIVAGIAAALLVPLGVAQFAWSQTHKAVGGALAAPARDTHTTGSLTVLPVEAPVNSGFGMRVNPITHKYSFHPGIDFGAKIGAPVKSTGDGVVTDVSEQRWKMGKQIEIDNGNGFKTRYAHLGSQLVKVGDRVTAGQVIALSGNSGVGTGPHLHFEIWQGDKPVDPATVLPLTH